MALNLGDFPPGVPTPAWLKLLDGPPGPSHLIEFRFLEFGEFCHHYKRHTAKPRTILGLLVDDFI
jgi:hypothetical protein